MCLLFIKLNDNCEADGYKLILVSVRDEYLTRPARKCGWWPGNQNIIGGMDMKPGREGGTWLAMNKESFKIGVLLNILRPLDQVDSTLKSRGPLVGDFLESSELGFDYLTNLEKTASEYSPFSMVTLDLGKGKDASKLSLYHNVTGQHAMKKSHDVLAVGNSGTFKPWKKLVFGKEKFQEIISKFPKISDKDLLVENIFQFLDNKTKFFPDEVLMKQARGYGSDVEKGLSSLNVCIDFIDYASRTKSIILVDHDDNVEFIEKTMKENTKCSNPSWEISSFKF